VENRTPDRKRPVEASRLRTYNNREVDRIGQEPSSLLFIARFNRHVVFGIGAFLDGDPFGNVFFISVQEEELPTLHESGEYIHSSRDTEKSHEGKDDGNRLGILDSKDAHEETDLQKGVEVDSAGRYVFGVRSLGVLGRLLEEQQETVPELDSGHGGKTHKEEDSKQHWQRNLLDGGQKEERESDQTMTDQVCETGFLYLDDLSGGILVGQVVQVDNAGNSGGNQPRKSEQTVDHVGKSIQQEVPVVRVSVLQVVAGVVDQVPRDTVIEVKEDKGKRGRTGSRKDSPRLSVQITHLGKPRAGTDGGVLFGAFVRPERFASGVTASKCRFKGIGDVEFCRFDTGETKLLDTGKENNRSSDGKVVDHVAHILVAKVARVLESAKEENGGSGSETNNNTEKGSFVHAIP
jgi:hypothetical protein